MNIVEMYEKVKKIYNDNEDEYYCIGLRFEDKEREIGEECEYSRHNADREDERDFPDFGTDDYEEMELLHGTSAWDMAPSKRSYHPGMPTLRGVDSEKECSRHFFTNHCYVIASNKQGSHDNPDDGEILIKDAVVIAKVF